jgi:hypothetical protein
MKTIYKGYFIEACESEPGHWEARVRRTDGHKVRLVSGRAPIQTSDQETFSAASAIKAAKQYIDNGNFTRGSPLARARSDFLH